MDGRRDVAGAALKANRFQKSAKIAGGALVEVERAPVGFAGVGEFRLPSAQARPSACSPGE